MQSGLSNGKKPLTPKQAKAVFHRTGKSVRSFAKEHGYCEQLVYMILNGKRPGLRGISHEIAVKLGMKNGVIEGD